MAYKNTETTSSIANEWGAWRYFNSALEKLGTYKPTTLAIEKKAQVLPQKKDWMETAGTVFKGALGAFQAKKKDSQKKADDYLKSHSLEQYKTAMQQGGIPFQDDPIAMQRLKYGHGSIISGLISQQFKDKIAKGEYKDLNPQQLDNQYYKYFQDKIKETSGTFSYDNNDYWFNRGIYDNTPKDRLQVNLSNMKVSNNWLTQQSLVNDNTQWKASLTDPNLDVNAKVAAFDTISNNPQSAHYTPQQSINRLNSMLGETVNQADGFQILQGINQKPLDIGGVKISPRDLLGQNKWKEYQLQARNTKWKADTTAHFAQRSDVMQKAYRGDFRSIGAMLAQQLATNGNTETDRAKFLQKQLQKAWQRDQLNAIRAQHKAEQQRKKEQKRLNAGLYNESLKSGQITDHYSTQQITAKDIRDDFLQKVKSRQYSMDDQMAIAMNHSGGFNAARENFTFLGTNALLAVDSMIKQAARNKDAPITKIPPELQSVVKLYQQYKGVVFDTAFSGLNEAQRTIIRTMADLWSTGGDYTQAIRALGQKKALQDTYQGKQKLLKIDKDVTKALSIPKAEGGWFDRSINTDSQYAKKALKDATLAYMYLGKPLSVALTIATNDFTNSHVALTGGVAIPRWFTTYQNAQPKHFGDYINNKLQQTLDQFPGSTAYYDGTLQKIIVSDPHQRKVAQFTQHGLGAEYTKWQKEQFDLKQKEQTERKRLQKAFIKGDLLGTGD